MKTAEEAWADVRPTILLIDLAKGMGLTRAAISAWPKCPAEDVIKVARLLRLDPHILRPDLYDGYEKTRLPWNDKEP